MTEDTSPKKADGKPTRISGELREASFERAPSTDKKSSEPKKGKESS